MSLAKAVANAAAMLVLKAKNVAQVAEDMVLQNRVIAAATQCALSTSQLVACAKVRLMVFVKGAMRCFSVLHTHSQSSLGVLLIWFNQLSLNILELELLRKHKTMQRYLGFYPQDT